MRVIPVILFMVCFGLLDRAEPSEKCAVCRQPIPSLHYVIRHPLLDEEWRVCEPCKKLESVCFSCGLPVKIGYLKLDDRRLLCEQHAQSAVLTQDSAERIFEEVKRDLIGMFSGLGVSPARNLTVLLVNQPQLQNLHKADTGGGGRHVTMGFTRSMMKPDQEFEHAIYLLSGLGPSRLRAVCAHEYAHAWVNENVPRDRQMKQEAEEGFCELVAYKLMILKNDDLERKGILANTYTKGQIDAFIKAESAYRFFRVVDWMKSGVDDKVSEAKLDRLLVLNDRPAPPVAWQPAALSLVPDTLVLKGISGTPRRRFALINDRTVEKNERARIRVGSSSVSIRCLDISENSVLIQMDGSEEEKQLFLSTN